MMLLVDAGNTRIKWGLASAQVVSNYGAFSYKGKPINATLSQVWAELQTPVRILVSNVAGKELGEDLANFCHQRFKRAPEFVQVKAQGCGVTNSYTQATQLGADRWAAMIGAYHNYKGPVCIVSCGTAITIDTVTREGRHLGGLIGPGIGVMQQALAAAAPAIPGEPGDGPKLYARDTRTAVTSGVLYAAAGFIERATKEILAQQGEQTNLLLTGGDAERLQLMLKERFTLTPHLVLEGLAVLAGEQT